MSIVRKGSKVRYSFADSECLGRECFAAGMFQHRSPLSCGGSRNTGSPDTPCCLNRAYRGCPDGPVGAQTIHCDCEGSPHESHQVVGLPTSSKELAASRKKEGWSWKP